MATDKTRARIVDALFGLLADRGLSSIGLAEVARAADVSLGTLRDAFDGKLAIIAGFSRRIDHAVLADGVSEEDKPRDRLFEVMMRRFDALRPHVAGLKGLARSARRDPALARALYRLALGSQKWMLVAANIHHGGLRGTIAINGAVLVYADTLRVFLEDDDPGLARTMAALDRALQRGERAMRLLDDACSLLPRLAERGRSDRRGADAAD